MEQAKNLQAEMKQAQENLEQIVTTGSAGADMVKVTINGANQVLAITIADEIYHTDNKKMLEDLIVAAVNNAYANAQIEIKKEMGKITAGFPDFPSFA
ncbi:MAG: YbaB/EbfC family nucleoid-associated protein [Bacteroidetes bacterium]|nr:YbaB/EbfC family nucleoid-associated protein [Bacteroidota bacterium]